MKNTINLKNKLFCLPRRIEWPTVLLTGLVYLSLGLLTWFHELLPWWLILPVGAYLLALFSSLQHETLHGHPTSNQRLNELLIFPALNPWIPYALYKSSHLTHHNNAHLTDPQRDPESFYIPVERWQTLPAVIQAYYRCYNTFAGRLLMGPLHISVALYYAEIQRIVRGDFQHVTIWVSHLLSCALVLAWVIGICGMSFWMYLLFFVYPGISLSLIRSFPEHRAASDPAHRTVIVESGPFFSLMFLNNNLHVVHHDQPGLAWYRIPAAWRARRDEILSQNGHYYFSGYREVIARFLWSAKESPCYNRS